jgi:hypothetical protein
MVAGLLALLAQPGGELVAAGVQAGRDVEGGAVRVVDGRVEVRAVVQEVFGGAALAGVAGVPERFVDLPRLGAGREERIEAVEVAECCGVPELVDPGATGGQEASHVPAAVADRVVQRGADRPTGCFQVGASVDQCFGDVQVVAAGRPVQRRLQRTAVGACVGVGAGRHEQPHDRRAVREVSGPVGDRVQRGAAVEPAGGHGGLIAQDLLQPFQVAAVDRGGHGDREGLLVVGA